MERNRKRAIVRCVIYAAIVVTVGVTVSEVSERRARHEENTQAQQTDTATELYGTRDGRKMSADPSFGYERGEFVALPCALSEELQEFTYYLCRSYYIDFSFAMALMDIESSYQTDIVSDTGDYGLMQINEYNHAELSRVLGITDFCDPYQNITAGLYILRSLFERYDDSAAVCMAYNLGEYGAAVLWEQGIPETGYSERVLNRADEFRELLG